LLADYAKPAKAPKPATLEEPVARAPNEPPAPEGTVRFYHGSDSNKPRSGWVSPNYEYARNYNGKESKVFYVDIPKGDAAEVQARQWDEIDASQPGNNMVGIYGNTELPKEWADRLKPIDTPAPSRAEIKAALAPLVKDIAETRAVQKAPIVERGAEGKPQLVIEGAEAKTPAEARAAIKDERAADEAKVRAQQSKMRRGGQKQVDEQAGGLFEAKNGDLFSRSPPPRVYAPRVDYATRRELEGELNSMASRIVGKVDVRFSDRIPVADQEKSQYWENMEKSGVTMSDTVGGTHTTNSLPSGSFVPGDGLIHVALRDPVYDPRNVMAHELMHHVYRWRLTPAERAIIKEDLARGPDSRLRRYVAFHNTGGDVTDAVGQSASR
jgi:hypothetical protein